MSGYKFTPSADYQEKEREAKAIRKDIMTARNVILDGITRYKKKMLRARSKREAEDLSVFDALKDYTSEREIQDAYGWEFISEAQYERLIEMWRAREKYIDEQGKFSDRVTQMLDRAVGSCGEELLETLEEFDAMKRQLEADIKRIERENRDNDYKRYINGL